MSRMTMIKGCIGRLDLGMSYDYVRSLFFPVCKDRWHGDQFEGQAGDTSEPSQGSSAGASVRQAPPARPAQEDQ